MCMRGVPLSFHGLTHHHHAYHHHLGVLLRDTHVHVGLRYDAFLIGFVSLISLHGKASDLIIRNVDLLCARRGSSE